MPMTLPFATYSTVWGNRQDGCRKEGTMTDTSKKVRVGMNMI